MGSVVPHVVGRYALYDEIASGGMASVHCGRLLGPAGFSRTVAIKRLHAQFAKDPEFVSMFLDEARMAARIRHPNVVPTLDVVARDGELFLVMEFVHGESLARLSRASSLRGIKIPVEIVSAILCGALHGLHAAHEATDERGDALGIVHRDVSPQNVLVGADGVARVLDFGVAKAAGRIHTTRDGQVKGKLAYMAPEQLRGGDVDRRTDVFAAGIMLWETLTLERLFAEDTEGLVVMNVLERVIQRPSRLTHGLPKGVDEVALHALERDPTKRFATAREMALALEASVPIASPTRVAEWVDGLARDVLEDRARSVARIESDSHGAQPTPPPPPRENAREDVSATAATELLQATASSSEAAGHVRASSSGNRRLSIVLAGAGLAFAAVGAFVALGGIGSRENHAPVTSSAEPAAPVAAPSAVTDLGGPPPPATSAAPPVTGSIPSASSAPSAPSVPVTTQRAAAQPVVRPCTVKSYLDESGIKHFRKECR